MKIHVTQLLQGPPAESETIRISFP